MSGSRPSLGDVLDRALLERMIEERFVVRRVHPTQPLAILNYTERCQYEKGAWNPVTLACRGMIYNAETGEVVARPFRKFFNYGQSEAPALDPSAPATVTDKLDGSLGILYGDAIATRGAFESEQAQHGTALFRTRYAAFAPPPGFTVLFEIVYPDNRIVCDYGDCDDLFLLGAVEIATGRSIGPWHPSLTRWPGPRAELFEYQSLADALANYRPRPNAEGVVVHLLDTDERVKIKQEDYVALHRIVTGLNERTVWEHLCAEKPLEELIAPLPDEFHDWVRDVAARLTERVDSECAEIERAYAGIIAALPEGFARKDFALHAVRHPAKWALFNKLSGKPYRADVLYNAKPEANRSPRIYGEDTA